MNTEISTVQLSESSLIDLAKLFKSVFKVEHSIEYLKKKYTHSNGLPSYCGYFAYVNSQPVAFCGGIPCHMAYNDFTFMGMQFCDTMTLPNWSGKGIFQQVTKALEKHALNNNLVFHFAFLNEHSYWAYTKKMDWEIVGDMRRYVIKGNLFPWHKLFSSIELFDHWYRAHTRKKLAPLLSCASFDNKIRAKNKCIVLHDQDFYEELPSNHYLLNIDGNSIWIKLKNGAHLGDIEWNSESDVSKVLDTLKHTIKKMGVRKFHMQFIAGDKQNISIEKQIKSLDSWKIGAKSFDIRFPAKDLNLVYGDIDTFV